MTESKKPAEITADTLARIRSTLEAQPTRSAWARGVKEYAEELLDSLSEAIAGGWLPAEELASQKLVKRAMLNGADDWCAFSWGGCSLIYNEDIARRLCSPSELKRSRYGERRPNAREDWLDVQARALCKASALLGRVIREEVV